MKLNLLPTYVGKEKAARSAIFLSVVLAAAGIAVAVFMITSSKDAVKESEDRIAAARPQAERAVAISKSADTVIQSARILLVNSNLAAAMNKHNSVYPDLYDTVRRYIPSYFRTTAMSAAPDGENTVVTLQGVIQTQQQYADLMLALMRIPGATSVTRGGYQMVDKYVPPLSENSQNGAPIDQGAQTLPDDPLQRLEYYMNQPRTQGFQGVGGFGTEDPTQPKGAMPDWSLITVSVTFPGNIQTPNPRATLSGIGGAPGTTPGGTVPAGGFQGGPPPGAGGPPPGAGGPPAGGGRPAAGDDVGGDR